MGEAASAALPVLWDIMASRDWSHARLAQELEEDSGKISKLVYGDRKPGRQLALKLQGIGVEIALWDEPLPAGWHPRHPEESGAVRSVASDIARRIA